MDFNELQISLASTANTAVTFKTCQRMTKAVSLLAFNAYYELHLLRPDIKMLAYRATEQARAKSSRRSAARTGQD